MSWDSSNWVLWVTLVIVTYSLHKYLSTRRRQAILDKWKEKSLSKNGVVILHGMYGNCDFLPSPSPFVLKLETYLRLAEIPYEVDKSDIWGPKGKTPWISFNGQHIGDSQFIIEFLSRELGKQYGKSYSQKERALALMMRVVVEEHLYWIGVTWRFAFGGIDTLQDVINGKKTFFQWAIFRLIAPQMKAMAWSQGVGRHTEPEIKTLMLEDLRAIASVLETKKFLLGNELCEEDCSIFAGLASVVFAHTSQVQDEITDELKNLKEYCFRIRDKLWPDWDAAIKKKDKTE